MRPAPGPRLRFVCGLLLLTGAVVLPVAALSFPAFGLPSAASDLTVALLVAGMPEILCIAAVALLGREGLDAVGAGLGLDATTGQNSGARSARTSRIRYYAGLVYCGLNTLPITLYAYVPAAMPGGNARFVILAAADLGFVLALLMMGGQFWEKFRRLFIWEPERPASPPRAAPPS